MNLLSNHPIHYDSTFNVKKNYNSTERYYKIEVTTKTLKITVRLRSQKHQFTNKKRDPSKPRRRKRSTMLCRVFYT